MITSFIKIYKRFFSLTFFASLLMQLFINNFLYGKSEFERFAESFITHYTAQPEGRYAHEYHPFLLQKTADSLLLLEETLEKNNLDVIGRMVLLGYEENAMPQYYTDYTQLRINDEASVKGDSGWSRRLHNYFGFMTGFLFRKLYSENKNSNNLESPLFEHILGRPIHLFRSRAELFQKHAFGQAYNLVMSSEQRVLELLINKNYRALFQELATFWEILYEEALKTGNAQIAGTQDILFSIAYAHHLIRSKTPLLYYVTGPDITYPIEPSCKYEQEVTIHAQECLKKLCGKLDQEHDEATAYIFCSFVDGVGKSTTLGNIQNWLKHGNNLHAYEHVDNSSSQLATLFSYKKNTFIIDLPAQISHFTYKPDGLVYVDARTELSQEKIDTVFAYFYEHEEALQEKLTKLLEATKNDSSLLYDKDNPQHAFIKNMLLLKKEKYHWVPFSHENQEYILKTDNPTELRVLIPLDRVKSEGLKNIEAEQMLFFSGIKYPPCYDFFLNDLITKITDAGIKKICFVDFMSMYPRSCRENVRINYLLQQMALLDENINPHETLYRNFSSGSELLAALTNKKTKREIDRTLQLETIIRYFIYKNITDQRDKSITSLSLAESTKRVKEFFATSQVLENNLLKELVHGKIKSEHNKLNSQFGLSKNFITIQQFSCEKIKALSDAFIYFLQNNKSSTTLTALWEDLLFPETLFYKSDYGFYDSHSITTEEQRQITLYAQLPEHCHDELLLTPIIRMLRAAWYALSINFLYSEQGAEGSYRLKREYFAVPPLYLSKTDKNDYLLLQKHLEPWSKDVSLSTLLPLQLFGIPLSKKSPLGSFSDRPYLLNWKSNGTHSGIFAYHCSIHNKKTNEEKPSLVTSIVKKFQRKHGVNTLLPTSWLIRKLEKKRIWHQSIQQLAQETRKNGYAYGLSKKELNLKTKKAENESTVTGKTIFMGHEQQRAGVQLLARLLATIEMIVKDPEAHVGVRFRDREDFKAALKLFELVTLPYYFTLFFTEPLFNNYDDVEPFPSWAYWDNIAC